MPSDATFESFEKELNRLIESFGKRLAKLKSADYNEAKLHVGLYLSNPLHYKSS